MKVLAVDVRCHALLNEIYCAPKVGVEIGVFRGDLSWRMLAANRNLFLYLVDPWREAQQGDSFRTTDDYISRYSQDEHDRTMETAMQQIAPFRDQCKVLRMTSVEAAQQVPDGSVDFVFIDGDHSYEGCSTDIAVWWPKLKDGGLLSGHDYRDERNYGVKQAVHEFLQHTPRDLRLGGNYTWFVTK